MRITALSLPRDLVAKLVDSWEDCVARFEFLAFFSNAGVGEVDPIALRSRVNRGRVLGCRAANMGLGRLWKGSGVIGR